MQTILDFQTPVRAIFKRSEKDVVGADVGEVNSVRGIMPADPDAEIQIRNIVPTGVPVGSEISEDVDGRLAEFLPFMDQPIYFDL